MEDFLKLLENTYVQILLIMLGSFIMFELIGIISKHIKKKKGTSITLQFTKGVLHEVDFNKFFAEQITAKGDPVPDRLFIYDVFGIKRDLKKAKIILTKSMFKCAGWLEDLMKNIWNVTFFDKFHDPMKFFFDKSPKTTLNITALCKGFLKITCII